MLCISHNKRIRNHVCVSQTYGRAYSLEGLVARSQKICGSLLSNVGLFNRSLLSAVGLIWIYDVSRKVMGARIDWKGLELWV